MKPEEIDKLFRFFGKISSSNHLNRGGMGFGLTITKMILHELGGTISVESQVQKGSKFIADLKVDDFVG
jgi:two-component system, OmpR family, phosphate regulon sensor histidine kinase PhoR